MRRINENIKVEGGADEPIDRFDTQRGEKESLAALNSISRSPYQSWAWQLGGGATAEPKRTPILTRSLLWILEMM